MNYLIIRFDNSSVIYLNYLYNGAGIRARIFPLTADLTTGVIFQQKINNNFFFAGCCYLDMPGNLLGSTINQGALLWPPRIPSPPLPHPAPGDIKKAMELLSRAKRPLIIVGKGKY